MSLLVCESEERAGQSASGRGDGQIAQLCWDFRLIAYLVGTCAQLHPPSEPDYAEIWHMELYHEWETALCPTC